MWHAGGEQVAAQAYERTFVIGGENDGARAFARRICKDCGLVGGVDRLGGGGASFQVPPNDHEVVLGTA